MIAELKSLNPEVGDRYGKTPLHVAASMPHSASLRAMLDVFYSGQDGTGGQNVDLDHPDPNGDSVLHMCCREGDVKKARMLLKRGADLEKRGANGFTVLHRLVEVSIPHCQSAWFLFYTHTLSRAMTGIVTAMYCDGLYMSTSSHKQQDRLR